MRLVDHSTLAPHLERRMFTLRTLGSRSHRALSLGRRQFSSLTQASPEKVNAFLQHYPQTEVTHLANGLRVASERRTGGTATIGAWINTGSRYEGNSNNGVAHFLEHMFFKGTSRRSRRSLEQEVENMGGHLNAYTSREQTVFFAKVFKEDIGKAADLLGDILQNSKFEEDRVDRERNTILTEMENVNAVMEEAVFDALHGTAYQGTSLGRTILGEPHNVQTISRDDIQQYFQSHYTADRIVIAAAGDIDHQELVKMCEEHFGGIPDAPVNGIQPYLQPARFTGSDWRWKFDDMAQAHLAIGFPVAGWNDADNYPLLLIAAMLGSYDKSVSLTSAVRGHSKFVSEVAAYDLAESVGVFNTQYSDTGLFGMYAVCDAKSASHLSNLWMTTLAELTQDVSAEQLEVAKTCLKMNWLSHLDGTTNVCEDIGRQIASHGRRIHPTEAIARIDAVDVNAIKAVANRYFYDRDFALSAIGGIHELPDYNALRSQTYSNSW